MTFEKKVEGTETPTALDEILYAHAEDDAAIRDFTAGPDMHTIVAHTEEPAVEVARDEEIEGYFEYIDSDDNRTTGVSLESIQPGTEEPAETVFDVEAKFVGFDQALKLRGATE